MFDQDLKLSKPLKIIYAVFLVGAFAISIYWTAKETGPAVYLIKLESKFLLGWYHPVFTVFLLVLPIALPVRLVLEIISGLNRRGRQASP